jgi:hypothetical protein
VAEKTFVPTESSGEPDALLCGFGGCERSSLFFPRSRDTATGGLPPADSVASKG